MVNSIERNKMNLSKIRKGKIFKNYKELCSVLEVPIKSGNSKISQLNEFKRYFDFEFIGYKIKIIKVYSSPLEKVDNRKVGNNAIYSKHLELILLNYLALQKSNSKFYYVELSTMQIALLTGMCNENYIEKNIKEDVTTFDVNDFYRRSSLKFQEIIKDLLSNLVKRRILIVRKIFKIYEKGNIRSATKDEETIINNIQKKALNNMGLKSIVDVYTKFKQKEFYTLINEICKEEHNWKGVYSIYEIAFTKDIINKSIEDYIIEIEQDIKEKSEVNEKIMSFLDNQSVNIYVKNIKYLNNITGDDEEDYFDKYKNAFKYHYNYVINQHKLCNNLIKLTDINK